MSNLNKSKLPEIIVFAGPNGSGKTTITKIAKTVGKYVNADNIKATMHCSDIEAAEIADKLREQMMNQKQDFTFETVLSTNRKLDFLKKAKENGYFIRCFYVLTSNVEINVARVNSRASSGGHGVPKEKIIQRYEKALKLIPELIDVCDIFHLYDNTYKPFRIFKKRKDVYYKWTNDFWSDKDIKNLTKVTDFSIYEPNQS